MILHRDQGDTRVAESTILYVDDEVPALLAFASAYGDEFRIQTVQSAEEGLAFLNEHSGAPTKRNPP